MGKRKLPVFRQLKFGLQLVGTVLVKLVKVSTSSQFTPSELMNDAAKPEGVPEKYWRQRYTYFSRFDEGIQLDEESWYSVTHEAIAECIATQCLGADRVIDAFAGAGGNVIQFANVSQVVAIELQSKRLRLLKSNAEIYGATDKIDFREGDFFEHAKSLEPCDVLFLSPPWGGPSYLAQDSYDIEDHMSPSMSKIIEAGKRLSKNFIFYLPRNTDILRVVTLMTELSDVPHKLEVQLYHLDGKFKALACFIGEFVDYDYDAVAHLLIDSFGVPRSYPKDPYLAALACSEDLQNSDFDAISALFTAGETEPPVKRKKLR